MRRLEYSRKYRRSSATARNQTEAVMVLAHVARERSRLEQERTMLAKRIRRIELRLGEIAGTETRLVPLIRSGLDRPSEQTLPLARMSVSAAAAPMPGGVTEVTLRY